MKTLKPINNMVITEDTRFEPGVYVLPDGITIAANDITLDGNGAHLMGLDHQGTGLRVKGLAHITIKNLQISGYQFGIRAEDCRNLTIKQCRLFDNGVLSSISQRDNFWIPLDTNNGCAILLAGVHDGQVTNNDLQHQAIGLCAYSCRSLAVVGNNVSHNGKFGFYLFDTADSRFTHNLADHCSIPFTTSEKALHQTIGGAGFGLVNNSSNNQFVENSAQHCTTGFLLEGQSPDGEPLSCSQNRFEQNKVENCSANGFSDIGNHANLYENNQVSHCSYGFLIKYCKEEKFMKNTIVGNHRAGIGAENSIHCEAVGNTFQDNRIGVHLWQAPESGNQAQYPDNETSKFWQMESNTIHRNGTGIRIAIGQDPGWLTAKSESQRPKPHDHEILRNVISDNRLGIQTVDAERTVVKDNHFELNLIGDIKS